MIPAFRPGPVSLCLSLVLFLGLHPAALAQENKTPPRLEGGAVPAELSLPPPMKFSAPVVLKGNRDEIIEAVKTVLSRGDMVDRAMGEMEVLRQMTPENAEAILKAYRYDYGIGRSSAFESQVVHWRVGQVVGLGMFDSVRPWSAEAQISGAALLQIEGWASVQPNEAIAWFKSWPRWRSRAPLAKAVAKGVAASNLALAETFMEQGDAEVRSQSLPSYFPLLFSQKGFPAALAWAEKTLSARRENEAAGLESYARTGLFRLMVDPALAKMETSELQAFVARHSMAAYCGNAEAQKLMKDLARRDPVGTLDWIPTVVLATTPDGTPVGFGQFAGAWLDKDESAVKKWLDTKPDHALRDHVAWAYADRLVERSRKDEALGIIATMKSDTLREKALLKVLPTKPLPPQSPQTP